MQLYVANPTKQIVDFVYRVTDTSSPSWKLSPIRKQTIGIGGQVKLSGELSQEDISFIIKTNSAYGFVAADTAHNSKVFVSTMYSTDKPVSSLKIEHVMDRNTQILNDRGRNNRKEAAIAEAGRLENDLMDSGRPERLRSFEASVVEENHDDRDESDAVSEGYRIVRDERSNATAGKRKRK